MGRHDTAELRKARGAFFTPREVSTFLADWAVRTPTDRVMEPSCGDASILLAAYERLRTLGGPVDPDRLVGIELHEASAVVAEAHVRAAGGTAHVHVGDFFTTEIEGSDDAVVGNPPYIRYQAFTGSARSKSRAAALALGVPLTGLSSSWAAFVVHAATYLREGGRLALVLPAELMTTNYAAPIRAFLLRRFGRVRLVAFDELVFKEALEDVVLLLADGSGPTVEVEVCQVRNARDLSAIDDSRWTPVATAGTAKWTGALLDAGIVARYDELVASTHFENLETWGRPYLGAVTGNNKWFMLTATEATGLNLKADELVRVSPPGSSHLRCLTFSEAAWSKLREEGRKTYLFYPKDQPSPAAQKRIAAGEEAGIDRAYKCRVRRPWWRVPLVRKPDLLLTYMNHTAPQLVSNNASVQFVNSVHGVELMSDRRGIGTELLPIAALNSITLLGGELVGRAYGGGMLKLEPREASRLPVPSLELVRSRSSDLRALLPQLAPHLRSNDLAGAARMVDRVLFAGQVGVRSAELKAVREGWEYLSGRRSARGKTARVDDR